MTKLTYDSSFLFGVSLALSKLKICKLHGARSTVLVEIRLSFFGLETFDLVPNDADASHSKSRVIWSV